MYQLKNSRVSPVCHFLSLSSLPETGQTNSPAALSPCHHSPVIAIVVDDAAAGDVVAIGLATAAGH